MLAAVRWTVRLVWWVVGNVLNLVLSLIGIPPENSPAPPFRTDHGSIFEQTASYVALAGLLIGAYLVYCTITAAILVTVTGVDFQTAPIFVGTLLAASTSGCVLGVAAVRWLPERMSPVPFLLVPIVIESVVLAYINL